MSPAAPLDVMNQWEYGCPPGSAGFQPASGQDGRTPGEKEQAGKMPALPGSKQMEEGGQVRRSGGRSVTRQVRGVSNHSLSGGVARRAGWVIPLGVRASSPQAAKMAALRGEREQAGKMPALPGSKKMGEREQVRRSGGRSVTRQVRGVSNHSLSGGVARRAGVGYPAGSVGFQPASGQDGRTPGRKGTGGQDARAPRK